jgi:transposase-like protein
MSRNGSRSYTRQFREQAMDLVRVQGREPTAAARDLGMPFSTLNLWLRKAGWVKRVDGPHAAPLPEDPAALKVRVAELERQVKRLETEREI